MVESAVLALRNPIALRPCRRRLKNDPVSSGAISALLIMADSAVTMTRVIGVLWSRTAIAGRLEIIGAIFGQVLTIDEVLRKIAAATARPGPSSSS
jgi:hypothetical protein